MYQVVLINLGVTLVAPDLGGWPTFAAAIAAAKRQGFEALIQRDDNRGNVHAIAEWSPIRGLSFVQED